MWLLSTVQSGVLLQGFAMWGAADNVPAASCVLLVQEQTDIAWFWSLAGNTTSTSGIWLDIGREVRACCCCRCCCLALWHR